MVKIFFKNYFTKDVAEMINNFKIKIKLIAADMIIPLPQIF